MKKITTYFGLWLSIALIGVFTACNPKEINESAEAGLGIKVFFPTKVVAGQPMTISGSGFADVREVVFPDGISVTNIEHAGNGMIRVTAPSGIASAGGKLIVRTADDEAESKQELTLGRTVVSGFSKQDGESIGGGEQLTVYGQDLEFICRAELLDPDGNPLILQDDDFYRKGTSTVIITIPKKIFEGAWVGKLFTYDGQEIPLPELTYEPAADGGHWETVKTPIWTNDGTGGAVSWNGTYRFALEGTDGNSEAIAELPQDVWDKIKTETFYVTVSGENPQIRVVTGWWNNQWPDGADKDIQPGHEKLTDNGDGTWTLEVNITGTPLADAIDVEHLLFTGDRYTVLELYFSEDIWVDGGGHTEIVKTPIWTNDGSGGAVSWNGTYRFALEGTDGNKEAIAELPQDVWDKIKTETFYVTVSGENPQIRVVTGWWNNQWPDGADKDIQPGHEKLTDNGDGTWTLEVNIAGTPLADAIDSEHLLFTGDRYTVLELYFAEEIWVDDGGGSAAKEVPIWTNDGSGGAVSWNGTYRFALEGTDGNKEAIAELPQDVWNKIKTGTFYVTVSGENPQIRVVTGWWNNQWPDGADKDIQPGHEKLTDNGDGTWTLEVNIAGTPLADAIDSEHLLFTGDRYTVLKLYFLE